MLINDYPKEFSESMSFVSADTILHLMNTEPESSSTIEDLKILSRPCYEPTQASPMT